MSSREDYFDDKNDYKYDPNEYEDVNDNDNVDEKVHNKHTIDSFPHWHKRAAEMNRVGEEKRCIKKNDQGIIDINEDILFHTINKFSEQAFKFVFLTASQDACTKNKFTSSIL